MKIVVIGCNGQLGYDMVMSIKKKGEYCVIGIDFPEIDITNIALTQKIISQYNPDIIINCSAYTAVDSCETNSEMAYALNSKGIENIALSAELLGAKVVHISTDYVFDGNKKSAYIESDITNPQTVYGKSKLEGEKKLSQSMNKYYIFRIAWLYGAQGNNFVKTIQKLAVKNIANNQPLKIVNDQYGSPTYTVDVCRQILAIVFTDNFGIYHCTNEGKCNWFDFASYITKLYNIPVEVIPCTTSEFPRLAKRPQNSVLENYRLKSMNKNIMPHWKEAFCNFVKKTSGTIV